MNININNFAAAKYDVFSMFNNRWALCTAGTPAEYNTMTIGWGTMGTIWGPLQNFIRRVRELRTFVTEFDKGLWSDAVEYMTVYSKEKVVVTFKDGTEI